MGLRRPSTTKDYEEMPGANIPDTENGIIRNSIHSRNSTPPNPIRRDFEMMTTSVSVVPDGELIEELAAPDGRSDFVVLMDINVDFVLFGNRQTHLQ